MLRNLLTLAIVTALCVLGCAFAVDATTVDPSANPAVASAAGGILGWIVAALPVQAIGTIYVIVTSLAVILGAVAGLVRYFSPESKIALWIDTVSHWLALIGTSFRPSQAAAVPAPKV